MFSIKEGCEKLNRKNIIFIDTLSEGGGGEISNIKS
jgi:hypothetical protein